MKQKHHSPVSLEQFVSLELCCRDHVTKNLIRSTYTIRRCRFDFKSGKKAMIYFNINGFRKVMIDSHYTLEALCINKLTVSLSCKSRRIFIS